MENKDQPAFPALKGSTPHIMGLTKREYFAAMAMQGLLAGRNQQSLFRSPNNSDEEWIIFIQLASDSVSIADTLLTELSSSGE